MKTALILSARRERSSDIPYPLKPFTADTCLIDRSLSILRDCGFSRIIIVTGYRHELFDRYAAEDVTLVFNRDYEFTASMGSLALCRDLVDEDFLLVEGDTFFERKGRRLLGKTDRHCGYLRHCMRHCHYILSCNSSSYKGHGNGVRI